VKLDLPFFAHYNTTHNEPKMQALLAEYGFEGYGRYWILCEKIASSPNAVLDISSRIIKLTIARALELKAEEFDKFIGFLNAPDIKLIRLENNILTSDFLQEDYQRVLKKRKRDRDDYNSDKNPLTELQIPTSENIHSKVDKSRVDKSSGGNSKTPPPPPLSLKIKVKNQIIKNDFFLDDREIESLILSTNADWFDDPCFTDFIAERVRQEYADKPKRERHNIFRKLLLDAQNLREEYPQWRKQKEREAVAEEDRRQKQTADKEKRKRLDQAKANKPKACGHCGTALSSDKETCPSCRWVYSFNETSERYEFQESVSLADGFASHIKNKKQAAAMETV